jgi:hypothetical protein
MQINITTENVGKWDFLISKGYIVIDGDNDSYVDAQTLLNAENTKTRLKVAAGSDAVYTLFCNTCTAGENGSWICSCDTACENVKKITNHDEFTPLTLKPHLYAIVECEFDGDLSDSEQDKLIDKLFWDAWIHCNPYICSIDDPASPEGIAAVYLHISGEKPCVKAWFPIEEEQSLLNYPNYTLANIYPALLHTADDRKITWLERAI